jgi:hypothetical protein
MTYPPGYPAASSGAGQTPPNGAGSRPTSATKDSRPFVSSSRRLSPRKLAVIEDQLSDRDLSVMALVGRFRVVSGAQLQRLFWPEGSRETRARLARHGLGRLTRLGVLAPLGRRIGGVRAGSSGLCYALGLAGQRLLASGRPERQPRHPYTPGERYLAHTLAVAELYVQLIERERECEGAIEDAIQIIAFDPEPGCWRTYPGPWGARLTLKPDAYLKLGVGAFAYSWLIERDMATESLATIERKAHRHLDYHQSGSELQARGVAPRVAWIVPDRDRAEAIQGVLDRLPTDAKRRFAVATKAEAPSVLATGAWS